MTQLRRALGPIAAAWLFYQVVTLTAAPIVFWVGSGEELLECTCKHGDHAICPMHHKPAPDAKICLMRSANDSGTAVLTSLLTGVGLIAEPTKVAAPLSTRILIVTESTAPSLRPPPPDPPPPRA